mgnify:CR=1 FL=1
MTFINDIVKEDPSWQTFTQCQIMLSLGRLLQLVPRFIKGLRSALAPTKPTTTPTYFTNPSEGPTVVDTNRLAVMVIIKGKEVSDTIINWGFGVNVISRRTCDKLGCSLWLRMWT